MFRIIFSIYFYFFVTLLSFILLTFIRLAFLFIWNKNRRQRIAQSVARWWGKMCVWLAWSKVEVINGELIKKTMNYVVVANHTSNFDIFLLLGFLGLNAIFISKRANFSIPMVGTVMKFMGCIPVNRKNKRSALESIDLAAKRYKEGSSIILFPEGTRNLDEEMKPFKEGFMHIAKKTPLNILPVSIYGAKDIQRPRMASVIPGRIVLTVNEEMELTPDIVNDPVEKKKFITQVENIIRGNLALQKKNNQTE